MEEDSGASETVVPPEEIKNVPVVQGEQALKGIKNETAAGELLPNLGEKEFVGSSENGVLRHLTAQAADVNQALLVVRRVMKSGHREVFDDEVSYIEDITYIPLVLSFSKKIHQNIDGKCWMSNLWKTKMKRKISIIIHDND